MIEDTEDTVFPMQELKITPAIVIKSSSTTAEQLQNAAVVVTQTGAVIKNRDGRICPENHIGCQLSGIDIEMGDDKVRLAFPAGQNCDMTGAVELARCLNPYARLVQTHAGKQPAQTYYFNGSEWKVMFSPLS